ncbi:MAG: TolB family protein [Gemmatimonadales bacterium]
MLAGCRGTLSPLSNRIKVGEEAFVVFVADGEEGSGDLFAVPAGGGTAFQVTFTRVDESRPALSPDGSVVAFARGGFRPDAPVSVALLNLVNGAERRIDLPPGAVVQRISWSADGTEIFIRTGAGTFGSAAPPASPLLHAVPASEAAIADSALAVLLGDPPFAAAGPCAAGQGLCALGGSSETVLAPAGRDPLRWGGDSVAFFVDNSLVVRPLGGGRERRLAWSRVPGRPREASYTPGPVER